MALPDPQPGLVISYSYLWHYEHNVGRDEGAKTRPCVIVLAIDRPDEGTIMVRVAPVTHSAPGTASSAVEIPSAVKRHLGLDGSRSWVILDESERIRMAGFRPEPYSTVP
jgi:hypothetical protein